MRSLFLHPKKTITLALGLEPGAKPNEAAPVIRDEPKEGDISFTFEAATGVEKIEYFPDIVGRGGDRTRVYPFLKLKCTGIRGLPPHITQILQDAKTGELKLDAIIDALDSRAAIDLAVVLVDRSQIDEVQVGKSDLPEASSSEDSGSTSATA